MATAGFSSKPMVAVVQMTSTSDKNANLQTAGQLIEQADRHGAQMVFLPEAFDIIGSSRQETIDARESLNGPTISAYKQLAKKYNIWLSLGGFHEKPSESDNSTDSRVYNSHIILDSSGDMVDVYRKTHLFDVDIAGGVKLKESEWTIPGQTIGPPVNSPVGKIGLGICYDMRFPEMSLGLRQQGAEILTFPSAFTVTTGMAHWQPILQCRAIENQCYVIAAAQIGQHNTKRSSYGHAMVVDPWGCVIAQCSDTVGLCYAEIDLNYLEKRRREMPVLTHRRHDLYGNIQLKVTVNIDDRESYQFGQHQVSSSHVFYRTPLTYAFVNRKPVLNGHVLISPIRCVARISELDSAEVADLFRVSQHVASVIENHVGTSSATLAVQDGPDAGQTVQHVHVHILPRKPGDFKRNDDVYEKLEEHDKDVEDYEWRLDDDMAKEAAQYRHLFS